MPLQPTNHRAAPPSPPALAQTSDPIAIRREAAASTHTARGLLILGLLILIASIARAGLHRAFLPGWWRQW